MSRMSWSGGVMSLGILCASVLQAQAPRVAETRIGVMGGVNLSTFGGDDTDASLESKLGFIGGLTLVKTRPGALGFEADALYSMKGSKSTGAGSEASFKLNYIEVPLLLRFDVPTAGSIRPHLVAGPALALRVGCSAEGKASGITVSLSCDEMEEIFDGTLKSFDVGLTGGGGIDFPMGTRTFTLGARYTYGLLNITDDETSTKNKAFSFFAGVSMPFGR